MKTIRTTRGPFIARPHYTLQEIDRLCVDELWSVGCFPASPEAVRIDRFVEKRFGITAEYVDLDEGILGYTKFGPKGPIAIVISQTLDEVGTVAANRRVRTTLAHEAGHILEKHQRNLLLVAVENKPRSLIGTFTINYAADLHLSFPCLRDKPLVGDNSHCPPIDTCICGYQGLPIASRYPSLRIKDAEPPINNRAVPSAHTIAAPVGRSSKTEK